MTTTVHISTTHELYGALYYLASTPNELYIALLTKEDSMTTTHELYIALLLLILILIRIVVTTPFCRIGVITMEGTVTSNNCYHPFLDYRVKRIIT